MKLNVIDLLQSLKVYVDVVDQPKTKKTFYLETWLKHSVDQIFRKFFDHIISDESSATSTVAGFLKCKD